MATSASLAGVSPLALLALPLAFTAAMTLCDTTNGVAMMRMYSSAIHNPQRRLGFNALITGISAMSALFISFITLGGFFDAAFGLEDPVTSWLGGIDLGEAGSLAGRLPADGLGIGLRARAAARLTPGELASRRPEPAIATKAARARPGREGTGPLGDSSSGRRKPPTGQRRRRPARRR